MFHIDVVVVAVVKLRLDQQLFLFLFSSFRSTSPPPLRAEQFIPGNAVHLQILKSMGISVTETDDGKVQLMQNAAVVS